MLDTGGGVDNQGIFLCAMFQCIISALVLSYSCIYCARQLKNTPMAIAAMLFYSLCPWIPKYAIMITKDTLFADFILLFGIIIHKECIISKGHFTINKICIITGLAVSIFLMRKNGIFVVIFTLIVVLLIYKDCRRKICMCIAVLAGVYIMYGNVLLPMCGITGGSVREALSIPFQQTARYVKYHDEEVTPEERNAIDGVLQYDALGDVYSGTVSDPVKDTFRVGAGGEELIEYFRTWFIMFFKHPETYATATMNNIYGYFYPVVNDILKLYRASEGSMQNANRDGYFAFSNIYDDIHICARDLISLYDILWTRLPMLNIFMTSAFYVWMPIICLFLKIINKDKAGLVFAGVYIVLILTALAGPCNAIDYERYIFPCILGFPTILGVALSGEKK